MTTTYAAFALTAEQAAAMGADPTGIMIQESVVEDHTTTYTGVDIYLDTDTITDTHDMDDALHAAGWQRVGDWTVLGSQCIADVTRS